MTPSVAPDQPGQPERRLLPEPPERTVHGPRARASFGGRRSAAAAQAARPADSQLPSRGVGYSVISYLIAGILAYGLIGWLVGRAVHVPILLPIGMLAGLALSMGVVIYRHGRSTPSPVDGSPSSVDGPPSPAGSASVADGQSSPTDRQPEENVATGVDR